MDFYIAIIFLFGLAVGSFLNVVIFRLDNKERIVNDRSKCMNCKHVLAWYDLVPVLSYLYLRGKCGYCGKKISLQYPAVEIITGISFVLIADYVLRINGLTDYGSISNFQFQISNDFSIFNFKFLLSASYYLFVACVLIVVFAYDFRHYIIPDKVIYPAIIVALVFNLGADYFMNDNFQFLISNFQSIFNLQFLVFNLKNLQSLNFLFAALVAGGFFLSIILFTKGRGMGGGDLKLGFLMGLVLGWPNVVLALFLSFMLGSFVGICLILSKKKKMKSMIPFGPFLVVGTFVALFWGNQIVKWYFGSIQ